MNPLRRTTPLILALLLVATAAACATRPVTLHGAEVSDSFAINTANQLNRLETTLATTGELLLAARSSFSAEDWDRIADTSSAARKALEVSRAALVSYIEKVQAGQAAGAERDDVDKALDVLTFLATSYVAFQGGGS